MADEPDLFGHSPVQGSLFGPGENRMQPPRRQTVPDPEDIRRQLRLLIETARAADAMPWPDRDVRMWQTVFPNMAKWLPNDEAEQLNLAFGREMERLQKVG